MILAWMLFVAVEVPAVGCAGWQTPARVVKPVEIAGLEAKAAQSLAYYDFKYGLGVLAPRGWTCFGIVRSSGDSLAVSPDSAEKAMLNPNGTFPGAAVLISRTFGLTSGRFAVANVSARFFPARRSFYSEFYEMYRWKPDVTQFASEKPTYISDSAFEYVSPPGRLGTGMLGESASPTRGVVMLVGSKPDMINLAVRMPENLSHLTHAIIGQARRHPWRTFEY